MSIFNLLGPRKQVETLDHLVGGLDGPPAGRMRPRANVDIDCINRQERRHEVYKYKINFWTVVAQFEQYLLD